MKRIKYIIELSIADTWIADGFDIKTNNDVKELLQRLLPYAYGHEVSGRVISKPALKVINNYRGIQNEYNTRH